MVGQLGSVPLAGITSGLYILYIPEVLGLGSLIAVNTFVSQHYGRRNFAECGNYCWQGIYAGVLLGCASMILQPLCPYFFALFGHEEAVLEAEIAWFKVAVLFLIPWYIVSAINNFYFGIGRARLPMIGALIAFTFNFIFDYLLIFGWGPFPALGIVGAAWGSVIGALIQALFLLACLYFDPEHERLRSRNLPVPSKPRLHKLLRVGIPNGLHEAAEGIVWGLGIVWMMGSLGTYHLAAAGVIVMLIDSIYAPSEGFGGTVTAMIGRDIGKRRFREANQHTVTGLGIVSAWMIGASLVILLFKKPILATFCTDPETYEIALKCIDFLPVIMGSLAVINVYDFGFNGSGDNTWPAYAHIGANIIFILGGGAALIAWAPHYGSFGIWLLITVDLFFVALLFRYRWWSGAWEKQRLT